MGGKPFSGHVRKLLCKSFIKMLRAGYIIICPYNNVISYLCIHFRSGEEDLLKTKQKIF